MSNKSNINKCVAIINGVRCGNSASFTIEVNINGMTARTYLPQSLIGQGWLKANIDVCGTHKNVMNGKTDPTLTVFKSTPINNKENQMNMFGEEKKGVACGNTKDKGPHFHPTADDVAKCYGVQRAAIVNQQPLKNQPYIWKTIDQKEVHWFPTKAEADEFNRVNKYGLVRESGKKTGWNVFPSSTHPYGNQSNKRTVSIKCGKCGNYHASSALVRLCYGV